MVYSIEQANAVATQLERFTTSYVHQLVGQFANLTFWLDEAAHALKVIDDYPRRFAAMRDAQREWVTAHGTVVEDYCPHCGGRCEFGSGPQPPGPPRRIESHEMEEATRRLKDAGYRFLLRCHRAGLLDAAALASACERISTSVDLADLKPPTVGD